MSLQYDPKFSLGNIITVASLICGLAVGWATMRAEIVTMQAEWEKDRQDRAALEVRLRSVEIAGAGTLADLRAIQQTLSRIERLLERPALTHQPEGPPR